MAGTKRLFRVIERIDGAHFKHIDYPLLYGDILVRQDDGTYFKTAPGLGIGGFTLTDEQRATLVPLTKSPPIEIVGLDEYIARGPGKLD